MTNEHDESPPGQAASKPQGPTGEQPDVSRGLELRRALLAKLPPLVHRKWSADQWVTLKQDSDLRAIIDLDANALLDPLEAIVMATRK